MSFPSASSVSFLNSSTSMTVPHMMKTAHREAGHTVNQQLCSVRSTSERFKPLKTHFHSNCCFKVEAAVNGQAKCPLFWPAANVNT